MTTARHEHAAPGPNGEPGRAWTVSREGALLVVSGGADEIYGLDDVSAEAADELVRLWPRTAIAREDVSGEAAAVLRRLAAEGIPAPPAAGGPTQTVSLRTFGDPWPELERAVARRLDSSRGAARLRLVRGGADLVVLVRINARLSALVEDGYERLATPHLLLDVAYHHTISLGPLVYPGETACLGCLVGRIGGRWGDPEPPPEPAVHADARLVASLLALELEEIAAGGCSLVNRTLAWDLRRRETARNAVWKLPWCPVCGEQPEALGSLQLPWLEGP